MGRPGLTQHRKFLRAARAIGGEALLRGSLELIWDCAYENGDDYLGDSQDVEAAARWTGEPGELTEALLNAGGDDEPGFIEEIKSRPGRYRVHDLWHHAPDYVRKRRKREAERRLKNDPIAADTGRQIPDDDRSLTGQRQSSPDWQDGVALPPAPAPAPKERNISSKPDGFDLALLEIFEYYLEKTDRNPKTYEFTAIRKRKGSSRLEECLRKTGNDLEKAKQLMKLTVDGLVASDWHMGRDLKTAGKKYCEWEDHLFGSYERMERWWNNEPKTTQRGAGFNGQTARVGGAFQ